MLAGVSVTWYTWLEQGRRINASADVLRAIGRALRLDEARTEHLLALAQPSLGAPADAAEADGCGPERYRVGVRTMLGADLDPDEMYEWAWTDFHHLRGEISTTCDRILPGAGFAEVIDLLEVNLPFLDEPKHPRLHEYEHQHGHPDRHGPTAALTCPAPHTPTTPS